MSGVRLLMDGAAGLLRLLGVRVIVHGREWLAGGDPLVLAANHVSYVDFAAIQAARPAERPPLWFLARWDLLPPAVGAPVMRRFGLVPVDERRRPGRSLPEALARLADGHAVAVHPEGRVRPGPEPARGRSGAVRLAAAAGVPLVPCSVWGTQRLLTRGRRLPDLRGGVDVHVRLGAPVDVSGPVASATRTLMTRIGELTRTTLLATHRPLADRSPEATGEWHVAA